MRSYLLGAALLALAAGAAHAQTSTFDTDAEGWGTLNDATGFAWSDTLGNPAGAVTARDRGTGAIWYYSAPAAYLGNRSGLLGGSVSWDILGITGNQTSIVDRADLMLVSGSGTAIGIDIDVQPVVGQWTSWSALLDASANWRTISSLGNGTLSNTVVTQQDLAAVLADLSAMYIRGEYTNGGDSSALDNVNAVPAPGAIALLAVGGLCIARRRPGRR